MSMHLTIEAEVSLHVPGDGLLALYILGVVDQMNFAPAARRQLAAGKEDALCRFLNCFPPMPDGFAPTLAVHHGLASYGRTRVSLGLEA
jgi:hypothetical protein